MINRLREIFPNLTETVDSDSHYLFTYDDHVYGIPYADLTEQSKQLLEVLLPPMMRDERAMKWLAFLNEKTNEVPEPIERYRFIILTNSKPISDTALLEKSFNNIFEKELIYFQSNQTELIILEPMDTSEDPIDILPLVDILSSDLEMNLRIFESSIYTDIDGMPFLFSKTQVIARDCFQYSRKKYFHQRQALLIYMSQQLTENEQAFFTSSILSEAVDDPDLLHTIETAIQCQLNISSAAKTLYMHRNTVQNKIDRFQRMTNLDLRNFEDSLTAYLAIQFLK